MSLANGSISVDGHRGGVSIQNLRSDDQVFLVLSLPTCRLQPHDQWAS